MVTGLVNIPIKAGLLPKCTMELKIARLDILFFDLVPTKEACLIPTIEFTKFAL